MTFKQRILQSCKELLAAKRSGLEQKLQDLALSAANETKSSAGDKYETSRAMLHMEQDQVRAQIAELQAQQSVLNSIDPEKQAIRAGLGSVVSTQEHVYFLSTALGKMQVEGKLVFALSIQSPLGAKLQGLQAGDSFTINGTVFSIREIN